MKKLPVLFLLLALPIFALAQPRPFGPEKTKGPALSAGAGIIWVNSIYKGANDTFFPLPVIIYREGRFSFNGLGASYALSRSEKLDLNAGLGIRFSGFDPDDSDYLEGMRERKRQINLGTGLSYKMGKNSLYLRLSLDLNNSNNGYESELGFGRAFGEKKFVFHPSAKVVYESHGRANLNYGVYRSEARADRPYYRLADAATFGLDANFIMNREKSSAFLRLGWKALNKKIIQSPVVNSAHELSVVTAYTWKF